MARTADPTSRTGDGAVTYRGLMARTVAHVGDELYALPPPAFTAARDEAVAQARTDGDAELARAVAGFKRPTVPAWLVNLVVLRHPEVLDELLALGERTRAAQGA